MQKAEYKVVPAPRRGVKVRGARTAEDRFARALSDLINQMAADGWDYLRAETLPSEERHGFTGRSTVTQNVLVFRRALAATAPLELAPQAVPAPAVAAPIPVHGATPALSATRTGPADSVTPRLGPARDDFAAQ